MSKRSEVRKAFWEACEPLKDDGMYMSDYIEQLTSLLFLKVAHESPRMQKQYEQLPAGARWENILQQVETFDEESLANTESHDNILEYYDAVLSELKNDGDFFRDAFDGVTNEFSTPQNFKKTVQNIESLEIWEGEEDYKAIAYEELLSRFADEVKGAGQYFTPRPLIDTMVKVTNPEFGETIHDPAAGTGGFVTSAYQHVKEHEDGFADISLEDQEEFESGITAVELVKQTHRLGLMNMLLHGLSPGGYRKGDSLSSTGGIYGTQPVEDHLWSISEEHDVVIANPPFGSNYNKNIDDRIKHTGASKIEFLFVQQIMSRLSADGRAAVVVPEGVLFNQSARSIREELLSRFNLHTVLVLPDNSFHPYAGVDANVLFFERDETGTDEVWYYDLRSGIEGIKESNELTDGHFEEFIENYKFSDREDVDRFFSVDSETIAENDYGLNFKSYKKFSAMKEYREPSQVLSELRKTTEEIDSELDDLEELLAGEGGAV